jgi:hypothetical protein
MTLQELLANLLTAAGGGAALWLIMGLIVKMIPSLDGNPKAKFWVAFVLAFVIPVGAYFASIGLGFIVFSYDGLILAIGVGYTISQGIHEGSKQIRGVS